MAGCGPAGGRGGRTDSSRAPAGEPGGAQPCRSAVAIKAAPGRRTGGTAHPPRPVPQRRLAAPALLALLLGWSGPPPPGAAVAGVRAMAAPSLAVPVPPRLVLFDMAGTTVDDLVDGKPAVMVAMQAAFARVRGKAPPDASVTAIRGLEKRDALKVLLAEQLGAGAGEPAAEAVDELYAAFKEELDRCLPRINAELPGSSETFRALQAAGIRVAVGSGFPQATVEAIVAALGWGAGLVDHVFSSEALGHGRPHPVMVHAAMRAAGVEDPRAVIKVGDTVVDIEEGKAACVLTVSVLTGTQGREKLEAAGPDLVLPSVAELPAALGLAPAAAAL